MDKNIFQYNFRLNINKTKNIFTIVCNKSINYSCWSQSLKVILLMKLTIYDINFYNNNANIYLDLLNFIICLNIWIQSLSIYYFWLHFMFSLLCKILKLILTNFVFTFYPKTISISSQKTCVTVIWCLKTNIRLKWYK